MNERLETLNALIGSWKTTITMLDADGRPQSTTHATDIYRWSPSNTFVLHDVDAMMEGAQVQSLEIIALDPTSSGYAARAYEADGSFADYHAELIGRRWSITGETLRFRGEFSDSGQVLSGQWHRREGNVWIAMMTVKLLKQT